MTPETPDWLIRTFAPRFVIDVAPEAFTFSRNGTHRSLSTYLYVRERDGSREVVAVGRDVPASQGLVRVDLFGPGQAPAGDRTEYLEKFLTYGLQLLHTRSVIRPLVIVRETHRLSPFLNGYEQGILRDVLRRAGASFVTFQ
jgi:hypothetical protein